MPTTDQSILMHHFIGFGPLRHDMAHLQDKWERAVAHVKALMETEAGIADHPLFRHPRQTTAKYPLPPI
jgi:hypothetical protein